MMGQNSAYFTFLFNLMDTADDSIYVFILDTSFQVILPFGGAFIISYDAFFKYKSVSIKSIIT